MKDKIKSFFITVIFVLVSYSLMLYPHYSPDSFYYHENRVAMSNGTGNLALGRFGNYLVDKIMVRLDFDYIESQFMCSIFLILCISFAIEIISCKFDKLYENTRQKNISKLAIIIAFCNVFLMEWFIFMEVTFQWAFSIIFMILAFIQLQENFNVKKMLLCIVFQSLSVGFYQATIGYFVIFSMLWIYVFSKGILNKKSIILNIKALSCGAIAGISNVIFIKIMQLIGQVNETSRTSSISIQTIKENVIYMFRNLDYLLVRNFDLFPPKLLIMLVCISYIFLIYFMANNTKVKLANKFIYMLVLVISCRGIVYFPHIITSQVWMAQRTIASFWTIISLPIIVMCSMNIESLLKTVCPIIVGIALFVNIIYIQFISIEVIASNKIDAERARSIYYKISEYEAKSGVNISTIAICQDKNMTYINDGIHFKAFDLNRRALSVDGACIECINFYNQQNYKKGDMDPYVYEKYFADKDWTTFNIDEQMVFIEDVLYLVIY